MEQNSNIKISSFILYCYRHFLNGNNESIEKLGTDDLKIPRFNEEDLISLCDSAIRSLKQINKTLLYISSPSIVIGDLHGNLHDLIRFMNSIIDIFSNRVLFLGDYIDRGQFQLETITVLLALRIEYPDHFFMIRGNHEFKSVNAYGGFKDEILSSGYSENLFNKINETFSWLPIAAVINDHIFCVHGGLSPLFHEIKQIETEFKLPIKNIYTNSTNPNKKSKLSDSSSSRVVNISLRSSLTNVNSNLNTNVSFLQNVRPKQFPLKPQEPNTNSNSNTKSHPPKFLPLCKKSNYDTPLNMKLPPISAKSPLPSLPDVKKSISPSVNLNSELENSIRNFPNSSSQQQDAANLTLQQQSLTSSALWPLQEKVDSSLSLNNMQQQNQSSSALWPLQEKVDSALSQNNQQPQSQQELNSNASTVAPLQASANSSAASTIQQQPRLAPPPVSIASSPPSNMGAFYISSAQLDLISNYKEAVLNNAESNGGSQNNIELLTDLMWSDPTNSCELFLPSNRGSGCYFGFVITNHFLKRNGMKMIVRGHESIKKGIQTSHEKRVVTIYSSSSLRQGGIAGCAIFDSDDNYEEFKLVPIDFVQRSEAKFFTPTKKHPKENKPLKLNSFSRSQSIFGNPKKLRRNMLETHSHLLKSSPNCNENMLIDISTIKEEEAEEFV